MESINFVTFFSQKKKRKKKDRKKKKKYIQIYTEKNVYEETIKF